MTDSQSRSGPAIDPIDTARSEQYSFVARILAAPPDAALLEQIATLRGDGSAMGKAFDSMAEAAAQADADSVSREYFELFVGVGRGELLPYGSFYQTGFLNERPLADLRRDLAALGVARAEGRHEPEDHIALLFEVMANIASGEIDMTPEAQSEFFKRHIAPWATQFFDDLEIAPSARFYRPLAEIGRLLIDIESRAFALAA